MKPSKIEPGTKLRISMPFSSKGFRTAYFVKRTPSRGGCKAVNYLQFPDFKNQNGLNDDGMCEMSDYDLSRRGEYA